MSTFGYVNAVFELREQIRAGLCLEPAEIIVAVRSASTLAGLTLGVRLAGLNTRVTGIRVAAETLGPFAACTTGVVETLERQALVMMHAAGEAQALKQAPPATLIGDYFGPGYGEITPAASAAIRELRDNTGLELQCTYSGKAAAAFLDRLREAKGPLLFWNTFNSRPLPRDQVPEAKFPDIFLCLAIDYIWYKFELNVGKFKFFHLGAGGQPYLRSSPCTLAT